MVATCASEVLTPSISYPRSLSYGFFLLLVTSLLPAYICASIFPHQENWNIGTYFDVAKIIGGNSFEVSNHPTIDNGVKLNMHEM